MDILEFGKALLETEDLDPVYCGIVRAGLPDDQMKRLLLTYWCFYHLGVAAWLSERRSPHFWPAMKLAAENRPIPTHSRWPRGTERRHFRGQKCVDAVRWLEATKGRPENVVDCLRHYQTEREVMDEAKSWPMFGSWVVFKVADMLERCLGWPIVFSADTVLLYKTPRQGLELMMRSHPDLDRAHAYNSLLSYFKRRQAPPHRDRPCGPPEVETILCKWKSHMGGHYEVGKDIREVRHHLEGWGQTAERILEAMPECP